MNSAGQELKKARESKGISLEEISNSTRITLKFLTAVEENRRDVFPGEFFLRAVLRSYAKSLGLNEEDVLFLYRDSLAAKEKEPGEKCDKAEPPPRPVRLRPVWLYTAGVVFLVGTILISLLLFKKEKPAGKIPGSTAVPAVRQEQTAVPPKVEPEVRLQEPPGDPVMEIALLFNEETWIQLFADGEAKLDGLLVPGQRFTTRALKEIRINLGNAGGFTYTLNGQPGKPFGMRGEVRYNILITPDRLREFQLPDQNTWPEANAQAGRS